MAATVKALTVDLHFFLRQAMTVEPEPLPQVLHMAVTV